MTSAGPVQAEVLRFRCTGLRCKRPFRKNAFKNPKPMPTPDLYIISIVVPLDVKVKNIPEKFYAKQLIVVGVRGVKSKILTSKL